jgi:hypothetical protein
MPAVVAAFDDIQPARFVAAVAIVFAGPKVSVLIERQFLWIPQSSRENLQV